MKKLLKLRFNNKDAIFENGKIFTDILPKPIIVDKVFDDESYLCHYVNGEKVYLKKTDRGDYYTNLFGKVIDPYCFISEKLDSIFCLVSRNANTSIVLSALYAGGLIELKNYSNDTFLWHDEKLLNYCHRNGLIKKLSEIKNFKIFKHRYIVFDEPIKRFIRALNKILIDPSLLKVNENLKKKGNEKDFIDEMLYFSNLCENDEHFIWERHLGLQTTYLNDCLNYHKNWEIIKLSELPTWWESSFGSMWLKNNVSNPSQRRLTLESFNEEQKEKMLNYLKKDLDMWSQIE